MSELLHRVEHNVKQMDDIQLRLGTTGGKGGDKSFIGRNIPDISGTAEPPAGKADRADPKG